MKNILFIIAAFVIIIVAGFFIFSPKNQNPGPMPEGMVLFYGQDCPHCKNVEDFISQNSIEEKIKFTRLEVSYNKENASMLANTAVACKIDISQGAPIPLFWDGTSCIVGDQPIIDFFKQKTNTQ